MSTSGRNLLLVRTSQMGILTSKQLGVSQDGSHAVFCVEVVFEFFQTEILLREVSFLVQL